MNCKQGDLAFIVRSYADNLGKIVKCIKFFPQHRVVYPDGEVRYEDCWEMEKPLHSFDGQAGTIICDSFLRPIRPGDLDVSDSRFEVLEKQS